MTNTNRTMDNTISTRSLQSVALTVALAAITHAYEFGPVAFAAGIAIIALLWSFMAHYRRTGRRSALVPYGLVALWVIAGLGIVGGFWNHAVKVVVVALHNGAVPVELEKLFMSPELGSFTNESIGVLTFVASLMAAYHGYRFVRAAVAK